MHLKSKLCLCLFTLLKSDAAGPAPGLRTTQQSGPTRLQLKKKKITLTIGHPPQKLKANFNVIQI